VNGEPITLLAQCSYDHSPGYISFLAIWCVYYAVFFSANYIYTGAYKVHDLRFYIACDQFKALLLSKILIGSGIVLSLVSGLGGLGYVMENGSDLAIAPILSFVGVNIYNLVMMSNCQFEILKNAKVNDMKLLFPEPIYINTNALSTPGNSYGMMLTHRALFSGISDAAYASIISGNSPKAVTRLRAIGDPVQLQACVEILNPCIGPGFLEPV